MKNLIRTTLAAAVMAAALPAAAQDEMPARSTSISLQVGSTSAIGVWRDLSPGTRLGLEIGGSIGGTDSNVDMDHHSLFVSPSLKLFSGDGPVRPYTTVGLQGVRYMTRYESDEPVNVSRSRGYELGAFAGVGVEWSPIRRVAVGGHVGVSGAYLNGSVTNDAAPEQDNEADGWRLQTFGSGIVLHLFF